MVITRPSQQEAERRTTSVQGWRWLGKSRLEGVEITQMGYLCQKRLSDRGKKVADEEWKLFYSVLCDQTLRFYRDQRCESDSSAMASPPDGQADPDELTQAGFLDVQRCLLRMGLQVTTPTLRAGWRAKEHLLADNERHERVLVSGSESVGAYAMGS